MNTESLRRAAALVVLVAAALLPAGGLAEERVRVVLSNGDVVTGTLAVDGKDHMVLRNEVLGDLRIKKTGVANIEKIAGARTGEPAKKKAKLWEADVAVGFNASRGNTTMSSLAGDFSANRKTGGDEFTVKGNGLYGSSDGETDTEKWYGMVRYAYSFGERKWYNFYRIEADHDRFANIGYRLLPSTGVGYWFSDRPRLRAFTEVAVGLESTHFRDGSPDRTEAVLVPRAFVGKKLAKGVDISQEVALYPSLAYPGEYRLHWETSLRNSITDSFFLRFSFIDSYNSNPEGDTTRKNDIRFTTSLGYKY